MCIMSPFCYFYFTCLDFCRIYMPDDTAINISCESAPVCLALPVVLVSRMWEKDMLSVGAGVLFSGTMGARGAPRGGEKKHLQTWKAPAPVEEVWAANVGPCSVLPHSASQSLLLNSVLFSGHLHLEAPQPQCLVGDILNLEGGETIESWRWRDRGHKSSFWSHEGLVLRKQVWHFSFFVVFFTHRCCQGPQDVHTLWSHWASDKLWQHLTDSDRSSDRLPVRVSKKKFKWTRSLGPIRIYNPKHSRKQISARYVRWFSYIVWFPWS